DDDRRDAPFGGVVTHIAFFIADAAGHQQALEIALVQARRQQGHVDGWPTDIQTRDDPDDFERTAHASSSSAKYPSASVSSLWARGSNLSMPSCSIGPSSISSYASSSSRPLSSCAILTSTPSRFGELADERKLIRSGVPSNANFSRMRFSRNRL